MHEPQRRWIVVDDQHRAAAQRRRSGAEGVALLWLTLLGVALAVLIVLQPGRVPLNSLLVPLIVGSLVLGPRVLPWFVVLLMTMLVVAVLLRHGEITPLTQASIAIEFLLGKLRETPKGNATFFEAMNT